MRLLALGLLVVLAAAGCGGSANDAATPEFAYLTRVRIEGAAVKFDFKSRPQVVSTGYAQPAQLSECGSGRPVRLRGSAFVVVHFRPAATAEIDGEDVVPTYTGPKRLSGAGPVLETAKSCDFEADVGWAIGLEQRLPIHLAQHGATITVSFG
jgi:hypothetical protein